MSGGLSVLVTNGSGPLIASVCPLKVDVSAGLLHFPGWHFHFGLHSNPLFLRLHWWGGSPICEDPFALEQDNLSIQVGPLMLGRTLLPVYEDSV